MSNSTLRLARNILLVTSIGVTSLGLAPATASAESTSGEGLVGAGSALATLVYGPAKMLYAAGGSLVAGLAWVHSGGDNEVVKPILDASLRGDYVITPSHLRGERTIEFVGRSKTNRALRSDGGGIQSEELYSESESYGSGF